MAIVRACGVAPFAELGPKPIGKRRYRHPAQHAEIGPRALIEVRRHRASHTKKLIEIFSIMKFLDQAKVYVRSGRRRRRLRCRSGARNSSSSAARTAATAGAAAMSGSKPSTGSTR